MESRPINVILLPSENVKNKSIELGSLFSKYDNFYDISNKKFLPHASIYQAQYPVKNFELVEEKVSQICSENEKIRVKMSGYENHHGYIWWNIEVNDELKDLHMRVLNELNPLREGLLLPNITLNGYTTGEKFNQKEAFNARTYGAIIVDKLFQLILLLLN